MKLSKRQNAIIVGSILGDAYVQATGKKNARLRYEHGGKQKSYLFWKVNELKLLFKGAPRYLERKHPISKETYSYWRHQSTSNELLGQWRKFFYPHGSKCIPKALAKVLTEPVALAVWYMDDGYYYPKENSSYLYLGRTSQGEAKRAQSALKKNFGLAPVSVDKKIKGFVLYFSPKQTEKLHKIVSPYMLPMFAYKLRPTSLTP